MARQRKIEPLVYDTQQVAALLSCSQVHVYRMLRDGSLMGVKMGVGDRNWRVTRESVTAWLNAKIAERKAALESERAHAPAA
jgi:excisionase family DNA binding protein